jgi:ADP-ribosylglycohydrolase
MGFHGHAFILSFYYLLRYDKKKVSDEDFYFNAVRETIRFGGDTDTNACIVGGMIGALVGFK